MLRKIWVLAWVLLLPMAFANEETEVRFPNPLVELSPYTTFVNQDYTVNSTSTAFTTNWNPGAVIRFTPIWRKKFPIYFHFGGIQLTEQNNAGIVVNGEHGNVKYVWTFGSRFGFRPISGLVLSTGLEFNHEPFLRDEGTNSVFLNKVLIPTVVFHSQYEWLNTPQFSGLVELAFKAYFSVPMDLYLLRNGIVLHGKAQGRWKVDDFQFSAGVFMERCELNTTVGPAGIAKVGVEIGVGWGYGS